MEVHEKPGRLMELVGIAALTLAAISFVSNAIAGPFFATQAVVTSCELISPSEFSKPISLDSQPAESCRPKYTRVVYEYHIDGKRFFGHSETDVSTGDQPQQVASAHPKGRELTVYVSRENPRESYLWNDSPSNESFLLFLGLGAYILAFLCHRFEPVARFFALTDLPEDVGLPATVEPGDPLFS